MTITHVTYQKINNRKEMKYICKVIRSDKVKREGANGTQGPMRGTAHDIIKTRLNLKDTKTRDDRGRIVQLTRYRDSKCQSDCAEGETCAQ